MAELIANIMGPAGPPGADGAPGGIGPTGPAGADSVVPGPAGPAGPAGADGEVAVVELTQAEYDAIAPGDPETLYVITDGADRTILTGTVPPAASDGIDGDFWIDTTTWTICGPKSGGVWPPPVPITGPIGPVGPPGADGAPGATGPAGADSTVPGPAGPAGPEGPPGVQGPIGETGAPGATGPAGADSTVPGPVGPTGPAGADSTVPGPAGPQGPAGVDGAPGADGEFGFTFMQDAMPTATKVGQTWFRTDKGTSYVWENDGNSDQWVQFAPGGGAGADGSIWYASTPETPDPDNVVDPAEGDHFLYGNSGDIFRYDGATWVYVGSIMGPAGADGAPGTAGATGPQGPQGTPVTVTGTASQIVVEGPSTAPVLKLPYGPSSQFRVPSDSLRLDGSVVSIGDANASNEGVTMSLKFSNAGQANHIISSYNGSFQVSDASSRAFIYKDPSGTLRFYVNGVECLALDGNYTWIAKPIQGGLKAAEGEEQGEIPPSMNDQIATLEDQVATLTTQVATLTTQLAQLMGDP